MREREKEREREGAEILIKVYCTTNPIINNVLKEGGLFF